jgi:hypothetical protein
MNVKPENQQQVDEAFKNWLAAPRTPRGTGENPPKPRKTYKKKVEEIVKTSE